TPSLDDFLLPDSDPEALPLLIDLLHVDLERRLGRGEAVRVEQYFHRFPELGDDPDVRLDLIVAEFEVRSRRESPILFAEYGQRCPELRARLRARFLALPGGDTALGLGSQPPLSPPPPTWQAPSPLPPAAPSRCPEIRGYAIEGELGRGAMGVVYK